MPSNVTLRIRPPFKVLATGGVLHVCIHSTACPAPHHGDLSIEAAEDVYRGLGEALEAARVQRRDNIPARRDGPAVDPEERARWWAEKERRDRQAAEEGEELTRVALETVATDRRSLAADPRGDVTLDDSAPAADPSSGD